MKTLATTIAVTALLGWFGPALDDHSGESEAARQAIEELRQQARFERAVREVCGENAAWVDLGNGSVQCSTKRGRKTIIAGVQP